MANVAEQLRRSSSLGTEQRSSEGMKASMREGEVAKNIEHQTASYIPSDWFMWAALGAMVGSLALHVRARGTGSGKENALFVGQWAPTLLIFGLYNKIVKLHGHE